jgi:hypothetical protein
LTVCVFTFWDFRLTSEDAGSSITTNGSHLLVVFSPPTTTADPNEPQLTFRWDSVDLGKVNGSVNETELNFVGGVNYVDTERGRMSWEKAGKNQQIFSGILNPDLNGDSMELRGETELEGCDLVDPCQCSYFGVYEVHSDSLRAFIT